MSTRSRPSTVITAHAASAHAHHGRVHAQVGGGLAGGGRAERAVQGDLEEAVGQQGHQRGGDTGDAAQPAGDERVERARVGMCRAIAMYPGRTGPGSPRRPRNAAGMPVSPVTAYAVGITPAATVSGATPGQDERQHGGYAEPVAGQRPGHRARPGGGRLRGHDEHSWSLERVIGVQVRCDSTALSTAVWVWAISSRRPGPSCGDGVLDVRPAWGLVLVQAEAQPARDRQPGQGCGVGGERPGGVQGGPDPEHRREGPVRVDRDHRPWRPGTRLRTCARYPACSSRSATSRAALRARNRSHDLHRLRSGLVGYLLQQRVPQHRALGHVLADHDRAVSPQADRSRPASARPAARRPARSPAHAAAAAACRSGRRAPAGTGHRPPARCRSALHPADPGIRGLPSGRRAAHACRRPHWVRAADGARASTGTKAARLMAGHHAVRAPDTCLLAPGRPD